MWEWKTLADKNALRDKYNIAADTKIICMLPGSRKGEINQHLPIFGKTLELLQKQFPQLLPVFVVHPGMRAAVTQATRDWPQKPLILWETDDKKAAFASASIALSKSGTVALELSLAGVPSIITYKVSSYSAWLMRRMVKVRFVNLINILLNKEVVPEMLQEKCAPAPLAEKLQQLLDSPDMQKKQLADAREALSMLGLNDSESPSSRAAKAVLDVIARA